MKHLAKLIKDWYDMPIETTKAFNNKGEEVENYHQTFRNNVLKPELTNAIMKDIQEELTAKRVIKDGFGVEIPHNRFGVLTFTLNPVFKHLEEYILDDENIHFIKDVKEKEENKLIRAKEKATKFENDKRAREVKAKKELEKNK